MASEPRKLFMKGMATGLLCASLLMWTWTSKFSNIHHVYSTALNVSQAALKTEHIDHDVCGDILNSMTQGRWRPRNVMSQEKIEVEMLYKEIRKRRGHPENLHRPDGRCGNVSLLPGRTTDWSRALCDVDGATPCCFRNVCVNRTREQCTCNQCLDFRQSVHAELATWTTENASCQPQSMSVNAMCRALSGFQVFFFIGDSLMRHVYTALLLLVRGDEVMGALRNDTPPATRKACSGIFMFTWTECRNWLDTNVTLCKDSVHVEFLNYPLASQAQIIHKFLFLQRNHTDTLVFLGMGIWDQLKPARLQSKLLSPLLQERAQQNVTNPLLVWMSTHCPGLIKNGRRVQDKDNVKNYNVAMGRFLKRWRVPVLDSFRLTENVVSVDGTHYGLGVNRLKAQIVLHYISALSRHRRKQENDPS